MRYILTFNECSLQCCNSDILFNQCLELRWRQSSQFSYIEQLWFTSPDRFSRQFMNLGPDILPQYRQVKEYVYTMVMSSILAALILHSFIKQNLKYYPARALRALGLLLADGTPTGGRGEDFLSRQLDFFTETAVTPERKVEKSFPRWEINRHVEG